MAIYNLYYGGDDLGKSILSCPKPKLDDKDLPLTLQPDLRVHGGYGFREYVQWAELMANLLVGYDVEPHELKVGDKLRIFVQPNSATLASVSVDFKVPFAGFEFKLQSVRELDLEADVYKVKRNEATGYVESEEKSSGTPATAFGSDVEAHTMYDFVFKNKPHTAKVDALELEITALPTNGLSHEMAIFFTRRFEQDGLHMITMQV